MEAIIQTGGKQYRVKPGMTLDVEKLDRLPGDQVFFRQVLLYQDNGEIRVGQPFLEDIEVVAKVLKQDRQRKVIVFKYKPKKRYRKKMGHRQPFTRVFIQDILEINQERGVDDLGQEEGGGELPERTG